MRRWEIERGLPVHRMPGSARGVVYAYTNELEEWLRGPQAQHNESGPHAQQKEITESDSRRTAASPALDFGVDLGAAWTSGHAPTCPDDSPRIDKAKEENVGSHSRRHILPWVVAGVLAIAVFAGVYSYRQTARFRARASTDQSNARAGASLDRDAVAVLPFTNVRGNANADYLSDGITESLIGNLAHLHQLRVRSRDSVFRYKGKDVELHKVGNDLGVAVTVSGRVMLQGDTIEVSAELTNVRENTEIWGNHYAGKTADLISLQQRMAGDIAEKLRSALSTADRQQVINQGTQDAEAYSLYLKGRYEFYNRTYVRLQKAILLFNQAIAKDPRYALPYAGLADVYSVLPTFGGNPGEDYPRSNAAARRALELDPALAHPHAVLGSNEMGYDWDFAGGEAEFKKAIELDPNDATAHQWYAERLAVIGGREQEAWAQINLAHQLDPEAPIIRRVMGSVLVMARRFDDAIAVCKQLESEDPSYTLAHDCLGFAYWGKRMYPQVVEEWKTYGQLSGNPDEANFGNALDRGFRSGGWKGAVTEAIHAREKQRETGYTSSFLIGRFYADLGDKERAFEWLDIAYREHDWLLIELNTNYAVDSLRSDPRFAELVRKVGLPQR